MEIKILGPGCAKCTKVEEEVKSVVEELAVDAKVTKVKDIMEIASYGVFGTPAVVIDDAVKCVGKIPSREEIKAWLKK